MTDVVINIPESSCIVVNSDENSENVSSFFVFLLPEKTYHPSKDFVFLKTQLESESPCSCQHNWFDKHPWIHYDIEKDCIVCFYCMKNM